MSIKIKSLQGKKKFRKDYEGIKIKSFNPLATKKNLFMYTREKLMCIVGNSTLSNDIIRWHAVTIFKK